MFNPDHRKNKQQKEGGPKLVEKKVETRHPREEARLNDFVSHKEGRLRAFNHFLKAVVLSAGISAYALQDKTVSAEPIFSPNQIEERYTPKDSEITERQKEKSKALFSKYFKDPQEVVEACGGIVSTEIVADDADAPTIVHIAQNHGTSTIFSADTQLSQRLIADCVTAMIDNNKTDEQFTVNHELVSRSDDKVQDLLLLDLLQVSQAQIRQEKIYSNPSDVPGAEKFSHLPDNLEGNTALLQIIKHYEPEKTDAILSKLVPYVLMSPFFQPDDSISELMHIFSDIQSKHNFAFDISDIKEKELRQQIERRQEMDQKAKNEKRDQTVDHTIDMARLDFDIFYNRREDVAFNKTLKDAKERGGVGVVVFGSGHDFRNEAYKAGVNLVRVETEVSHVSESSMVDYRNILTNVLERLDLSLESHAESAQTTEDPEVKQTHQQYAEIIQSALEKMIKEDPVKLLNYMVSIQEYGFIMRHFDKLKTAMGLTNDDLFNVVVKSIDRGYAWYIRDNLEEIEENLSFAQIAEVKRMID